jgi:cbb3-type cytochrome oxidase maturation protein
LSYFKNSAKSNFVQQISGMSVIYLLISISIVVAVGFLIAFIRAVKSGQYDDDYTPSVRMLFDDELKKNPNKLIKTDKQKSI